MRVSIVCSSDELMDIRDTNRLHEAPVNEYRIRCNYCLFPDIEEVPQPYYLMKNRIYSGIEVFEADLGNLLVSSRIKAIIERLFPCQCTFYKTYIEGENITTKWWLAAVNNKVVSGEVKDDVPRCEFCGQPLHAHPGTQYKYWHHDMEVNFDIVKSENWHTMSIESRDEHWLSRDLFLSVRFIGLLKKLKAKGIFQYFYSKNKKLLPEEKQWIDHALYLLDEGLRLPKAENITLDDIDWLKESINKYCGCLNNSESFRTRFKTKPNQLIDVLLNIQRDIILDEEAGIKIVPFQDWETNHNNSKKNKLISFCFDDYGNSWSFNPKDKNLAVYYYNHEYDEYDLVYSTIIEFLKMYMR